MPSLHCHISFEDILLSTILTLVLVPVVYILFEQLRVKLGTQRHPAGPIATEGA